MHCARAGQIPKHLGEAAKIKHLQQLDFMSTLGLSQVSTSSQTVLFLHGFRCCPKCAKLQNVPYTILFSARLLRPAVEGHSNEEDDHFKHSYTSKSSRRRSSRFASIESGNTNRGVYWDLWQQVAPPLLLQLFKQCFQISTEPQQGARSLGPMTKRRLKR